MYLCKKAKGKLNTDMEKLYLTEAGLLSLLGKTSSVKRPNFRLLE